MFILLKNLKHNEKNNEDDVVARNQYIVNFIKKTNLIFFSKI